MVPTIACACLRLPFGEGSRAVGARAYSTLGHDVLATFRVPLVLFPALPGAVEAWKFSKILASRVAIAIRKRTGWGSQLCRLARPAARQPTSALVAGVISDISEENPPCRLHLAICFRSKYGVLRPPSALSAHGAGNHRRRRQRHAEHCAAGHAFSARSATPLCLTRQTRREQSHGQARGSLDNITATYGRMLRTITPALPSPGNRRRRMFASFSGTRHISHHILRTASSVAEKRRNSHSLQQPARSVSEPPSHHINNALQASLGFPLTELGSGTSLNRFPMRPPACHVIPGTRARR